MLDLGQQKYDWNAHFTLLIVACLVKEEKLNIQVVLNLALYTVSGNMSEFIRSEREKTSEMQ